ncbi:MAG: phage integrase N-terminal SAM-like domain-containing protein, partial [Gammaproteobacteria bacterium]
MSLREKTLEAMRQRGYSPRTQSSYVDALKDLARFSHQPPDRLDE